MLLLKTSVNITLYKLSGQQSQYSCYGQPIYHDLDAETAEKTIYSHKILTPMSRVSDYSAKIIFRPESHCQTCIFRH